MKEQNAAHSFEADFHVTKEQFKAIKEADVIRLTDGQEYIKKEVAAGIMKSYTEDLRAELTRLRSELQQEREKQFNLPDAAVFNLQQIALADDDMVKVPGAAEQYRFIARHILELFQKSKAK